MAEETFTLNDIAKLTGSEYRTLKNWVARCLFLPSIRWTTGSGNASLYSERDLEIAAALVRCRKAGLGMAALELVAGELREFGCADCPVCGEHDAIKAEEPSNA